MKIKINLSEILKEQNRVDYQKDFSDWFIRDNKKTSFKDFEKISSRWSKLTSDEDIYSEEAAAWQIFLKKHPKFHETSWLKDLEAKVGQQSDEARKGFKASVTIDDPSLTDKNVKRRKLEKNQKSVKRIKGVIALLKSSRVNNTSLEYHHVALTLSLINNDDIKSLKRAAHDKNTNVYSSEVARIANKTVWLYNDIVMGLDSFFMTAEVSALGVGWAANFFASSKRPALATTAKVAAFLGGKVAVAIGVIAIIPVLYAEGKLKDFEESHITSVLMELKPLMLDTTINSAASLAGAIQQNDREWAKKTHAHDLIRYLLPTHIPVKYHGSHRSGYTEKLLKKRKAPNAEEAARVIEISISDGTTQSLYDKYSVLARNAESEYDRLDLIDITNTIPGLKDLSKKIEKLVKKSKNLVSQAELEAHKKLWDEPEEEDK